MRVWGCLGGGVTSATWKEGWDEEKRACRRTKCLFLISPLKRFQILSKRNKKTNVNKNDRKLLEEILRQIAKYSHGKKGKKRRQNLLIQKMIVAEYANIALFVLFENRSILIADFAGSR